MNLFYTLTAYPPSTGGAQFYQHMLATHLNIKHNVQVFCQWDTNRTDWLMGTTLKAPHKAKDYTIDGVPVHRIGFTTAEKISLIPYVLLYYPFMSQMASQIAHRIASKMDSLAKDADLIHNVRIGREPLTLASYQMARAQNIPFVLTPVHHPRWKGWPYSVYTSLYKVADGIITLTDTEKQALIEMGISADRIFVTGMGPVLANASAPEQFIAEHRIDGPIVLFVGQHYSYKGFKQLLQAAPIVWKKFPDTHFVFIGPPVGKSGKAFESFTDRRIHRLGKVSLQQKTDALAACDLLCLPSLQESFGGVYTEAWSFGKPVIGCNIPAVAEVIADGIDGFLVKQDAIHISGRICDLLSDHKLATEMGEKGKNKVESRYTWSRLATLTDQVYNKVLGTIPFK